MDLALIICITTVSIVAISILLFFTIKYIIKKLKNEEKIDIVILQEDSK